MATENKVKIIYTTHKQAPMSFALYVGYWALVVFPSIVIGYVKKNIRRIVGKSESVPSEIS